MVDSLTSISDSVPILHHIDVILKRLPSYFSSVVSVVKSKSGLMELDEVEILHLTRELSLKVCVDKASFTIQARC